jgi:hypothetical protein
MAQSAFMRERVHSDEAPAVLSALGVRGLDGWTQALRGRQNQDGSFGSDGTPQQRFHATMMATWALALK